MEDQKKTALITGASSGLGRSLALAFAQGGYNLILSGRNKGRLKEIEALALIEGAKSEIVRGDITLTETIEMLAERAVEKGVDVLINNAGIYADFSLVRMTPEAIRRMIDTNLLAPILLTRRLFPLLKNSRGLVVNINSLAGKEGTENESIYCASKHGLRGFSSSLQYEATENGVRIVEYYFGGIQTPMAKGRVSFEKFIDPDEVAHLVFALSIENKTVRLKEAELGRKNYS